MKSILYLDMDGVLADFEGKCQELFGETWQVELSKPEWGKVGDVTDIFKILDPMPDAMELYDGCCEFMGDRNRVQILTALPNRAAGKIVDAAKHKTEWAKKHINSHIRVHFGPFAQHKQLHVRHAHDILVDDMKLNIEQWEEAGGCGVWHKNANTSLKHLLYLREFIAEHK